MTVVKSPLPDDALKITGEALQDALVDLIDLTLVAKQVHWNLTGSHFRSVHLQLDEVVTMARNHTDIVAERAAAIGVSPDGRAKTVAAESAVPGVKNGWIKDTDGIRSMTTMLRAIVARMRQRVGDTAEADPVTQDLFIDVARDLEKQAWMFEVQLAETR
ncbi:MAG TPA: DNA starvation/stationary phase protection protein [Streptosporangiaceae bacterium]|nr:DNA starvation/stationary phase protection protein [Streptosporangiaceae bacterium]